MKNRICEILGIEKPVVQGPMVWLTDAKLVAAVSNAGGLGSLGPNAGQTTVTRDPVETAERMRAEIRKVRELTDKPFSVNILPPYDENAEDVFTPPMLKVIYEERVPVVTYVGGIREPLFKELKEHGIKIIFRSLNPDPDEAKEAERCGADIIVATGFDEGGTLPDMTLGTFSIVPLIVDAVDHVPVMAAGGISNSRAFNAVMALGAEGAYCGTAFLMSKESRMAENVKQRTLGYAPRTVLPDVFFDFYQMLCHLCDEVADKVSPETERKLLEVVDEIQRQLLLPKKSTTAQIRKEVQSGTPRSLLRGEKEHPRSDNPVDDLSATDMSGV